MLLFTMFCVKSLSPFCIIYSSLMNSGVKMLIYAKQNALTPKLHKIYQIITTKFTVLDDSFLSLSTRKTTSCTLPSEADTTNRGILHMHT
jgi:hypothetical protein